MKKRGQIPFSSKPDREAYEVKSAPKAAVGTACGKLSI
jgi:hypothetical protein